MEILKAILDKSILACRKGMEGISEVDIINLGQLLRSKCEIDIPKDQEKKRKEKDIWISQKCADMLQMASRTNKYVL